MKLLFVGDSLIEYFDWQEAFPNHKVSQHGVPGETVQGLLSRANRIISHVDSPSNIVFMTGTNNIVMEDFGFIPVYEKVVALFSARYPEAKCIITSLLPIQMPWIADSAVPHMNQLLDNLCRQKNALFLNIFPYFLDNKGQKRPELFMEDGVHLTTEAYTLWAISLADNLDLQ